MDDSALADYMLGVHFGPVSAGRIDPLCANLLGVLPGTEIWLSDYTLRKLAHKHGTINFSHYKHITPVLLLGFIARGRKPNLAELWWINAEKAEAFAFQLVLKATIKGEVFVETFHSIHLKEARRLARNATKTGRMIRLQSGFEMIAQPRD